MRRRAINTSLTLYAVSGDVWYKESNSDEYTPLAQGAYRDFEQDTDANNKWMVKLGNNNSACELHRRVVPNGAPSQDPQAKKETLCLRVAVNNGKYTQICAASRPRLRKNRQEAGPSLHTPGRRMHRKIVFSNSRKKIHYHVRVKEPNQNERFKITIVKDD
ncbi:hypothetical protein AYO49_02730 [Verrucomicrobiaceae bacterium SCGC AG-212-N21]|nr:hypothetical protein AYO49_02730 [Verrucomicrobiaceae bacterium SCGC AG-212-N21]